MMQETRDDGDVGGDIWNLCTSCNAQDEEEPPATEEMMERFSNGNNQLEEPEEVEEADHSVQSDDGSEGDDSEQSSEDSESLMSGTQTEGDRGLDQHGPDVTTATVPVPTEELSVIKQEPGALARASNHSRTENGRLDQCPGKLQVGNEPRDVVRDTVASQVTESREVRGLAKQMDQRDRLAKGKAKNGLGSSRHPVVAPSNQDNNAQPQPSRQPRTGPGLSQARAKLRATYLQTGLKPGAYPDRTPVENTADNVSDPVTASRRFNSTSHVLRREPDISVGPDLEEGRIRSAPQLGILDPSQPLVEAFVVADEVPAMDVPPSPKEDIIGDTLLPGDYQDKPKLDAGPISSRDLEDSSRVKVADLLLHRNMLLLIGCLICFFVIVTVLVVVIIMTTVVDGTSVKQAQLSQNEDSNSSVITALPTMPEPTALPTAPSPLVSAPSASPIERTRKPSTKDMVTPASDEATVTTSAPTMSPSMKTKASDRPTSAQTSDPTPQPSLSSTPAPTVSPPTSQPTELPSLEPTIPIAPLPTSPKPSQAPTADPTPWPSQTPSLATANPTEKPSHVPTHEPTVITPSPTIQYVAVVNFTIAYTLGFGGEPSMEEQSMLNVEALKFFTDGLEAGLEGTASSIEVEDSLIVSSRQRNLDVGWWQSILVEYIFEGGLPALALVVDAFMHELDSDSFMSEVRQIGPSLSTAVAFEYEFEIPHYGR